MQRPCFALTVLLGSIVASMLLIDTVNSQCPTIATVELPPPACVTGWVADARVMTLVLGQSIDSENDDWSVNAGNADLVASDGDERPSVEPSLAGSPIVLDSRFTLVETGYDSDYDRAMSTDVCRADECGEDSSGFPSLDEVTLPSSVASLVDDLWSPDEWCTHENHCFELESERISHVEPVLLPGDYSAWLWHRVEDSGAWMGQQVQAWWSLARDYPWLERFQQKLTALQVEEGALGATEEDLRPVSTPTVGNMEWDQELMLLGIADSLDQVGLQLQDFAQEVRFWAVERIVLKGKSGRFANRPSN